MKNYLKAVALVSLVSAFVTPVWSAEQSVAGKWKAQFDSQIGTQKYTFEFKVEGTNLTGKAIGEREIGTNEVQIVEGKIKGDEISFIEPLKLQDNEIRIEYTGKVKGDEIKLHRKVGDIAEYDIVAKRVKESDVKSEAKAGTNAPPAKP